MKRYIYDYAEIKSYINEGDVLLFRGQGWSSKLIAASTETNYSHVALASWINCSSNTNDGILECIEFRESSGGRAINLQVAVETYPKHIDVYRPINIFSEYKFNNINKEIKYIQKPFNGKAVTNTMRKLTGLAYGWKRIWWIFQHKLWVWKLFGNKEKLMIDEIQDVVYPVCSTAVSYAFNKNGFDLVKNTSDEWCEPGTIAKSARLTYLFTLTV